MKELEKTLKSKDLLLETKVTIIHTVVFLIAVYSSES